MKEALTILAAVGAVAFLGFQFVSGMLVDRKLKRIASLPTGDLKDMFAEPKNGIFLGAAAKALQERGEDLSFALPTFLNMALSSKISMVIVGKGCLISYFPDAVRDIDLSNTLLKKTSKLQLKQLKQKVDELTRASSGPS